MVVRAFNRVAMVAQTKERMGQCLELRKQGYSYEHIGKVLNVSYPYARKLYFMAIKRVVDEPAKEMIKIELERLDKLMVHAYAAATRVNEKGEPIYDQAAIDSVLKIMDRRSRYMGLDTPVKVENKNIHAVKSKVVIYLPDNSRQVNVIENGTANYAAKTFPNANGIPMRKYQPDDIMNPEYNVEKVVEEVETEFEYSEVED